MPDTAFMEHPVDPAAEPTDDDARCDLSRVDLRRVLNGLRHLPAAAEPARVFTDLAAVCVPALCDECVIEIAEQDGHRYRIRRPGPVTNSSCDTGPAAVADVAFPRRPDRSGAPATVAVSEGCVLARFGNLPGGSPTYTGELICRWHYGYLPTGTDAVLVGVLIDHATAHVHQQRERARVRDLEATGPVGSALNTTQRIAAATGVLMALYHLTPGQARELLRRAADRGHHTLRETADTVLHTGALPVNDHPGPAPETEPKALDRDDPDHHDPDHNDPAHNDVEPAP